MRRFFVLLRKELRELITPQMLVPFVLVIVMFFAIGQIVGSSSESAKTGFPIRVIDGDKSAASALVIDALKKNGFAPQVEQNGSGTSSTQAGALAVSLPRSSGNVVVAIPAGFGVGLAERKQQQIETWAVFRTFSFLGTRDVGALNAALAGVNQAIASEVAKRAAPNVPLAMLQQPVKVAEHVVIGGKQATSSVSAVMGFVTQQTTFIPIVLFVVIIFASQMIGTAIANEKENKTLETLLSYPISRASLVTAKMLAAGLIALTAAAVYMVGMRSYIGGLTKGFGAEGASAAVSQAVTKQLGLAFNTADYLLLGLSLFAGILVALSMSIILGAFADSVKNVQALLTPITVLVLIPYLLTLFLDVSQLPPVVRFVVMAIPFTYPLMAGPNLFLGNYAQVWFGILYQLVWFGVLVIIAARIFSSDRILTMKLSLGRKRKTAAA